MAYADSSLAMTRLVGAAEDAADHAAGLRKIVDAARKLSAEVLRRAGQAFGLEIAKHELGVLRPDQLVTVGDVAAAEDLDLHPVARAPGLDQLVDQLLHREIAVARRLRLVSPAALVCQRQHEVVHAADADMAIANAGGNARAEDGGDDLVGLRRDVEFARQDLDDPGAVRRIVVSTRRLASAVVGARQRLGRPDLFGGAAHASLR